LSLNPLSIPRSDLLAGWTYLLALVKNIPAECPLFCVGNPVSELVIRKFP